jgi:putative exosortase-associated protein (TIGR04073 family)
MRKIIVIFIAMSLLSIPFADADQRPVKKLYRGIVNILTAPIEVPKQARAYWIKGAQITPHILAWIGSGAVWGIVQSVKRVGSGVWDVVSFPFEKPSEFEPLLKPDFVFDQWPRNPKSGR